MTKGIDKYSIDSTDYTVGQDNVQKWGFDVHNPVFGISAGLIALFLIGVLITDTASAKAALDGVKGQIINSFDWLFIWSGNIFVIFCLGLIVSPYGKIRLGGVDATADYSFMSWLSITNEPESEDVMKNTIIRPIETTESTELIGSAS